MSGHMSMLQAEVALLKENVIRMKLAGIRYAGMASTHSSAEVSAAAINAAPAAVRPETGT